MMMQDVNILQSSGLSPVSTTGAITANVIDASGLTAQSTGTATFTMGGAAVGVTTITGSGEQYLATLLGDAASTIDGGAGNDTITGGTGNDTLTSGAGNDTITTNTGSNGKAGAGNDVVNTDSAHRRFGCNFRWRRCHYPCNRCCCRCSYGGGVSGFERPDRYSGNPIMAVFTASTFDLAVVTVTLRYYQRAYFGDYTSQRYSVGSTASVTELIQWYTNTYNCCSGYCNRRRGCDGVYRSVTANNEETITLTSGSDTAETLTVHDSCSIRLNHGGYERYCCCLVTNAGCRRYCRWHP